MPSINVNSPNIVTFQFNASFDLYQRKLIFDISGTVFQPGGQAGVTGVCFHLEDIDGLIYHDYNFGSPDINPSTGGTTYTLDLTSFGLPFLKGNTFKIIGAIKDNANGQTYYTTPVNKTLCSPVSLQDSGYVPGMFQVISNCVDNILTVKEITAFVLNGKTPISVTKSGTLYYPTGTNLSVPFTGTPFTNNVIYTGENRVKCTTVATYDLGDGVYELVSYVTDQTFKVTCGSTIQDLACCLIDLEQTARRECDNAKGVTARQKMMDVSFWLTTGLLKEINGQDASYEAQVIRKYLNCDCGATTLGQNEATPLNPAVTSIILQGAGDTTIPAAIVNGDTKTFTIASNAYQVVKGNPGDLAWSITVDTSTQYLVKYVITFNYDAMANNIYTATAANPIRLAQFNSLVAAAQGVTGLNGKCVINTSQVDYSVSEAITGNTIISQIVINGTVYNAPANLNATNTAGINAWLNGLSLGTFNASLLGGVLTIISTANTNVVSTITFTGGPNETKQFGSSTKTLVQILQSIIDYLCGMTACQVALCRTLTLSFFNYDGSVITQSLTSLNTQDDYDVLLQNVINNIVARMNSLTGVTCATLKNIFLDSPASQFAGGSARAYGLDSDGKCVAFTPQQLALGVMQAVNAYQNVKNAFCDIDCTVPANCPDVSAINMAIISGNIGVYGVTFNPAANASQVLTVRYRVHGSLPWVVSTNNLSVFANGNLQGTSPYQITGLSQGTTYDVWIQNNCGGAGFVSQITVPTGTVYSGTFLRGNILYLICGGSPVTLYSNASFGTGVTMYTDPGLTTPLTGYSYIAPSAGGSIYLINSSTGVVGSNTGSSCNTGTPGSYKLGNNSGTICNNAPQTLYTNGAFVVGGVLYYDSGLTTPVTGFSFVVNPGDSHIYNLNSSTGVIGSDTGLSCTINYTLSAAFNLSIDNVSGTGIPSLPPTGTNGSQSGFQTGMSGNYTISLSGTLVTPTKLVVLKNGITVLYCTNLGSSGPVPPTVIAPISALSSDNIIIAINSGSC